MVQIVWTERAVSNLEFIRRYLAQFDPAAAERLTGRLIAAADGLREFPRRGRDGGNGCRELATVRPYLIRYEVDDAAVTILRLRHASQLPDDD